MITQAIKSNLQQISCLLSKTSDFDLANDMMKMLDLFSGPEQDNFIPNVELTLKLTRAVIRYFFLCMAEEGNHIGFPCFPIHKRRNVYLLTNMRVSDITKKLRGMKIVCHLLKAFTCYSPCARVLALREILRCSINNDSAKYFGAKEKFHPKFEEMLLLHQNHKQVRTSADADGKSILAANSHASYFLRRSPALCWLRNILPCFTLE